MMRSLFSAVAGLRAHQSKMDVIGNNISNVNTYGFKASRATFSDVLYQSLSSGSSANAVMGGTNPTQIGYGAALSSIDVLNTQSGPASTDRPLDAYIDGDGYYCVKNGDQVYYTRLGNLRFDPAGNIVDQNGNKLQGFSVTPKITEHISAVATTYYKDPTLTGALLTDINNITTSINEVKPLYYKDPTLTGAALTASSNITTDPKDATNGVVPMFYKDNKLPAGTGVGQRDNAANMTNANPGGTLTQVAADIAETAALMPKTEVAVAALAKAGTPAGSRTIEWPISNENLSGVYGLTDVSDITLGADMSADPNVLSLLTNMSIAPDGTIRGILTEDFKSARYGEDFKANDEYVIGKLAIARFPNTEGMLQVGNSYLQRSVNSGDVELVVAGTKSTGLTESSYLEMSNVDISKEFTDMITTQRGFQANTRIITVSDEMLQELVNLKR